MTDEALHLPVPTPSIRDETAAVAAEPNRWLSQLLLSLLRFAAPTSVFSPFVGSLGPNGSVVWSQLVDSMRRTTDHGPCNDPAADGTK